jgi:mevalonate kinase
VILLGEHAVVYGRPALAAAIDRQVVVTVIVTPTSATPEAGAGVLPRSLAVSGAETTLPPGAGGSSQPTPVAPEVIAFAARRLGLAVSSLAATAAANLPIGVGLGSSAACSVALLRALSQLADRPLATAQVCTHAFAVETLFHGFPSGIDNTVATHGGLLRFVRDTPFVRVPHAGLPLVIAVGRAQRRTREVVTALRQQWAAAPAEFEAIFDEVAALVADGEAAIRAGDLVRLGAAMNANHELLQRLGVSTEELDAMTALARAHGAAGAKLTGAGGGGAIICVCNDGREHLVHTFRAAGWAAFATDIGSAERGAEEVHESAGRERSRAAARA